MRLPHKLGASISDCSPEAKEHSQPVSLTGLWVGMSGLLAFMITAVVVRD